MCSGYWKEDRKEKESVHCSETVTAMYAFYMLIFPADCR